MLSILFTHSPGLFLMHTLHGQQVLTINTGLKLVDIQPRPGRATRDDHCKRFGNQKLPKLSAVSLAFDPHVIKSSFQRPTAKIMLPRSSLTLRSIPTCFAFRWIWEKKRFKFSSSTSAKAHFTILWRGEILPTHRTRSPQRCQHRVQGIGTGVCHQFLLELPVEPTNQRINQWVSLEVVNSKPWDSSHWRWLSCQSILKYGFLETWLWGLYSPAFFSQARSFRKVNFQKVFQPTLRRRRGSWCNCQIKRKADPTWIASAGVGRFGRFQVEVKK